MKSTLPVPRNPRCKATWKREFKLPWREAGPLNHHDDIVDFIENDAPQRLQALINDGNLIAILASKFTSMSSNSPDKFIQIYQVEMHESIEHHFTKADPQL